VSEETYSNPLITRYASREMALLWSNARRIRLWRRLWIILARAQRQLGLPITQKQIDELEMFANDLNLDVAAEHEKRLRHDVMAHVHAYGDQCPNSRGIIHWGATSCYVTDNADLMMMRDGLQLVRGRLLKVIESIADWSMKYASLPCLAYTHFQPAQPTTVGKRGTLWAYDLVIDLEEIDHRLDSLLARSVKGTTGTQASFLQIFDGDHDKVRELEGMVAQAIGFPGSYAVTGQTYPRKIDSQVVDLLSQLAQSMHKIATDLRLLAHEKEIEEPFEKDQIGSSAMAYKRNPMRCERICSLARYAMSLQSSPAMTAATQWLERTLDDSANRRLVIPQAFLAIDACLVLMQNVFSGLVVYPKTIAANLNAELPFMATEAIMMEGVQQGGDRQALHEAIRVHSHAAAAVVKQEGKANDLLSRIKADKTFAGINIDALTNPELFVGRAAQQVVEFLDEVISPIRSTGDEVELSVEIKV
jgi:adenylosuccinate lyase